VVDPSVSVLNLMTLIDYMKDGGQIFQTDLLNNARTFDLEPPNSTV